ncbi:hypothetical protein TNCV_4394251 [Trichonephila clavipes]|uniref:Uncharacterized protein n=1 Tax=Trichonephila clavipes TaxID=2585209 RepID=A0A8X6W5G0_TRICX|nr:hypothetical protein TNCV_4394251 [Trichonephila clavipes]
MSYSPVPLKTRVIRERCTLNLSIAQTSSRWCGAIVKRGPVTRTTPEMFTGSWFEMTWSVAKSPRVAKQCDVNIPSFATNWTSETQRLQHSTFIESVEFSLIQLKATDLFILNIGQEDDA